MTASWKRLGVVSGLRRASTLPVVSTFFLSARCSLARAFVSRYRGAQTSNVSVSKPAKPSGLLSLSAREVPLTKPLWIPQRSARVLVRHVNPKQRATRPQQPPFWYHSLCWGYSNRMSALEKYGGLARLTKSPCARAYDTFYFDRGT